MSTNALELNKLSDDQVEAELKTLQTKADVTPEEKEKLSTLKEERQTRYQKRLDKLTWEKKKESEGKEALRKELEEIKAKQAESDKRTRSEVKPALVNDTIEISGKKFYTDEALSSMVENSELTPQQAYSHQRARDKAEIIDEVERRKSEESKVNESKRAFDDDKRSVLEAYPHFNPSHPDHDPSDELFKTANELWQEGLHANPRGLSIAIKRAKQILRMSDERPDVSNDHNVGRNRSASEMHRQGQNTEVSLSSEEKDAAGRMYGGIVNPKTNRNYTQAESEEKAIKAKIARKR